MRQTGTNSEDILPLTGDGASTSWQKRSANEAGKVPGAVETDGSKSQDGAPKPPTVSNVVPFPRDWLGPREELVPFGRDAVEKPVADAQAADVQEISLAPPRGPEAFWGEDSAEIHGVLQGPDVAPGDDASEPTPRPPATKRRPSRAFALLAAALLAAVGAGVATIVGLGGKSSPPHEAITNPVLGNPRAEHVRLARLQKSLAATASSDKHRPRKVERHPAARPSRHRPVHRSAPKPVKPVTTQPVAASSSSVSTAPSSPVSSSTPSQPVDVPSSSSTGGVVSEPSQPTSSSTASGGATSSHSAGQSSKAKAPAGPTGNSALLGPGHCNC